MTDMMRQNEDAALKTVGARVLTDRHTDTHTHTHTDMTKNMIVAHRRWATIIIPHIELPLHHASMLL